MAFVTRTRVVQYADLVNGVQTVLATPVVLRTSALGTVYWSLADAMAAVPSGQRPTPDMWWKYRLEEFVNSFVVPHVRGVVPDTARLVFDVDFWDTSASQAAAPTTPQRRNTFVYEFTSTRLADAGPLILAEIDDYLMRAEFNGYPSDGRDPRIVTTTNPVHDPLNLLARQSIQNADGTPVDTPAHWREWS